VICVIDDDEDIRLVVRTALELEGYEVAEATDGASALTLLRERTEKWGLLLLDLMMPGMNGWEFRRHQLADPSLSGIPVIVFSGAGGVAEAARQLGASTFLTKPIDLDELIASVKRSALPVRPAAPS